MDPEEIENRQFLVQLRGYARDEVESFREEVAQEIKILRKQLTKATSDLSHANNELAAVKAKLAEERSRPAPEVKAAPEPPSTPEPPAEDRTAMFRLVGQETERILLAAEEAAEQIHERAEKEAAELLADTRMRVERSLAEFDAARRAAEEDFAGIRDSRSMVASQLEDIRRRLEETISRLRVPVQLPGSKPASRFRSQSEQQAAANGPSSTPDRGQAETHAEQRLLRELEAAKELQARQTAHRQEADRRAEELKAVQAEAEQRARVEAQRLEAERAAAEAAAQKARQAAELQAAVAAAREADRLKAGQAKAAEDSAAAKSRAEQEASRQAAEKQKADKAAAEEAAEAKARSEAERAARADAAAKELRKREAEKAGAAGIAKSRAAKERTAAGQPPAPSTQAGSGASSLDELLAEIRRKREEEERQEGASPDQTASPASAPAAGEVPEQLARRRDSLGDLPAQTARRLKRLLQEEHNDLLDRLRTQRGKGGLEDNIAPQAEQLDRFVAGLSDTLGRAFSEGRKAAGAPDADPADAVTKLVTRQVLKPLRGEISKAIEAGLEAEDSASNLSERANDVFRVWKGVRTQLLGEGISYAAYHQGMIDGWSSREGAVKHWVLSSEEAECPNDICRRNADAGAVSLNAAFPSGHQAPPAHGGCTCTLKGS